MAEMPEEPEFDMVYHLHEQSATWMFTHIADTWKSCASAFIHGWARPAPVNNANQPTGKDEKQDDDIYKTASAASSATAANTPCWANIFGAHKHFVILDQSVVVGKTAHTFVPPGSDPRQITLPAFIWKDSQAKDVGFVLSTRQLRAYFVGIAGTTADLDNLKLAQDILRRKEAGIRFIIRRFSEMVVVLRTTVPFLLHVKEDALKLLNVESEDDSRLFQHSLDITEMPLPEIDPEDFLNDHLDHGDLDPDLSKQILLDRLMAAKFHSIGTLASEARVKLCKLLWIMEDILDAWPKVKELIETLNTQTLEGCENALNEGQELIDKCQKIIATFDGTASSLHELEKAVWSKPISRYTGVEVTGRGIYEVVHTLFREAMSEANCKEKLEEAASVLAYVSFADLRTSFRTVKHHLWRHALWFDVMNELLSRGVMNPKQWEGYPSHQICYNQDPDAQVDDEEL